MIIKRILHKINYTIFIKININVNKILFFLTKFIFLTLTIWGIFEKMNLKNLIA